MGLCIHYWVCIYLIGSRSIHFYYWVSEFIIGSVYILLGLDLYIFIIGSRDSRVYALISSIRSLYTEARIQDFGKGVGEHGEYVTGGGVNRLLFVER